MENLLCFCSPVFVIKNDIHDLKNRMAEIRHPIDSLSILCMYRFRKHYCLASGQKVPSLLMQMTKGPQFKLDYGKMGIFAICNWEVSWGNRQAWLNTGLYCSFPSFSISLFSFCLIFPLLDFFFKEAHFSFSVPHMLHSP